MKLLYALLAHRAVTDQVTNELSIFDVIEEAVVTDPTAPVVLLPAVFVSCWQAESEEERSTSHPGVFVIRTKGEELVKVDITGNFRGLSRNRHVIQFNTFRFMGAGDYEFVLRFNSGEEVVWTLPMTVASSPSTSEASASETG